MTKRKPLTDEMGEVRELEVEDFREMRSAADVLPPELVAMLPKRRPGRPQRLPTKEQVTIRLDRAVLDHFRAGGRSGQSRINEALRRISGL